MCLAPSVVDETPGVMHGVPSHSLAHSASNFITSHNLTPKVMGDAGQVIGLNVSLLECDGKNMVRRVHVIVVTQCMSDADYKKLNWQGHGNFPVDVILTIWLFGGDYMRDNINALFVLGEFGLEGKLIPPKYLFVA